VDAGDGVGVADADELEPAVLAPHDVRDVDAPCLDADRCTVSIWIEQEDVACDHQPVAADRFDHGEAAAIGGRNRDAELAAGTSIEDCLLTPFGLDEGEWRLVPRVLARAVRDDGGQSVRPAPIRLPNVQSFARRWSYLARLEVEGPG